MTNKRILVTGGASGIGLELVKTFLQAGGQVAIWDYSSGAISEAQKQLVEFSDRVYFDIVNVAKPTEVSSSVLKLPWEIDILVNNAGITRDKSFAKMSEEDWDAVISVNLSGLFYVTKGLFSKFATHSNRRIINISSVVGIYGNFGQSNYAATKAGVIGLTKTLAKELGRKGFTVNAIAPGFIQTPMTSAMPAEVLEQMATKVPVGRLGTTSDIAHAALFLADENSGYINGAVLSVDGGIVL